jgi:ketosteroid isomerase-like protein
METTAVQSKEEVAREIAKIYEEMAKSMLNWDDNNDLWTEDGINMPLYGITQNIKEMMDFLKDIALNNRWEMVDYKPLELFVHDDMAYEFSLFEHNMTPKAGGETVNTKMRCISVYKREDGKWKLHRWMPQYKTD